jgi:Flp pilus assembly pilin Flp
MRSYIHRVIRDERGLTTAEYAVGTVAVAGLGGILAKLLSSDQVRDLVWNILRSAFSSFFGT